jgi:hypothetical protein
MNMLRLLLPSALILFTCRPLAAQTGTATCPDKGILSGLKEAIDSARRYPAGVGGYRFADYRIVHEAACAGKGMDKNRTRQRIALMWQRYRNEPAAPDNSLRLRDVLRYAFRQRYQPLMLAAAQSWGLDLNEVDESGQTLLQFLGEEIDREPDSSRVRMLKEYRDIYIAAGAADPQHLSFMVKILSERFDAVKRYAYGLYAVEKKGKWGLVNHKGEVVIPLQYQAVRHYLPDLFEVSTDGVNYYFVDRKNKRTRGPWE